MKPNGSFLKQPKTPKSTSHCNFFAASCTKTTAEISSISERLSAMTRTAKAKLSALKAKICR